MKYFFDGSVLFKQKMPLKIRSEFEYLLFFTNPVDTLVTQRSYSKDYLDFLKSKFNLDPKIEQTTDKTGAENFWQRWDDSDRYFESQVESAKMGIELSIFEHDVRVIENTEELNQRDLSKVYITKNEWGFAGKGVSNFEDGKVYTFPLVLEEKLNRKIDFSIAVNKTEIYYQNHVNENYQYQGTTVWSIPQDDFLSNQGVSDNNIAKFNTRKNEIIAYLKKWNCWRFNMDCFIYENVSGNLDIHPVCELNTRTTMGQVFHKIAGRFWGDYKKVSFKSLKGPDSKGICLAPKNFNFFVNCYPEK